MLLIDTSSQTQHLALFRGQNLIAYSKTTSKSHQLIVEIEKLLTESHCKKEEIQEIAIGVGPGSFTGTRIGVMVAKTLAFGLKKPLIPFNSMILFTPSLPTFTLVRDARSSQYYVMKGKKEGEQTLFHPPELLDYCPDNACDTDQVPIHFPFIAAYLSQVPRVQYNEVEVLYLKNPG
ncbi:MAG: tRNA (adenosine(37)-N6)-threonylcarbamoyltransferase complex dimerization subunit type 1 TsaB [Simkaniaceae bacterium]|nr:tRNA (adenosine(37)-N6)-threonylcarbamoyltransferase complex dimerization subunit type 1 TsaB [Simkaniaceae bacterium]